MNIIKFENQQKDLEILKSMALIALKSEKYEGYNEATIMNIFMTARALGVDPMLALNGGFNIIKGKINMGAHFMVALARRAGHSMKVIEMTDQKCVIIGKRKDNDDSLKYEMTMQEAANAGLTGKQNWRTNPKQMLYCACVRNIFRILFCDIAIPYDADEMNVEESVPQSNEVGVVEMDASLSDVVVATQIDCRPKEAPSYAFSDNESFLKLKDRLAKEEMDVSRLGEWIHLRSSMKEESPESIINACLIDNVFPMFKQSYEKWLVKDSQF